MLTITFYTYQTDINYTDIDINGVLTHKGALRMLQEAAALASDSVGYGLKDVLTKRVAWMITGWKLELLERPNWPATVTIHTWPRTLEGFFSDRDFEMFCEGRMIARATSRWLLVNIDTGHTTRIAPEVSDAYELNPRAVFDTPIITTGHPAPDAEEVFTHVVGRRDIDTNNHVNNLHYLDYALECLPDDVWQALPNHVEILYRKQIRLGTTIHCFYTYQDGRHQVEIRSDESRTPHAFLWFH